MSGTIITAIFIVSVLMLGLLGLYLIDKTNK
jgi:hypothetical protein